MDRFVYIISSSRPQLLKYFQCHTSQSFKRTSRSRNTNRLRSYSSPPSSPTLVYITMQNPSSRRITMSVFNAFWVKVLQNYRCLLQIISEKNSNSLEQRIALFTGLEVPSQFDQLGFICFFVVEPITWLYISQTYVKPFGSLLLSFLSCNFTKFLPWLTEWTNVFPLCLKVWKMSYFWAKLVC